MSDSLENYLRRARKKTGLSQEEVAFLLALHDKGSVGGHEGFKTRPLLETALAYEALYRTSLQDLFQGLYRKVERRVHNGAEALLGRLKESGRLTNAKLETLQEIIRATSGDLLQEYGTEE